MEYSPRHKRKLKQDAIPTINVHGLNASVKNLDFEVQSDTGKLNFAFKLIILYFRIHLFIEICDDSLEDPKLIEIGTLLNSGELYLF